MGNKASISVFYTVVGVFVEGKNKLWYLFSSIHTWV